LKAAILGIGTELLTGLVRDYNAYFLAQKLVDKGILPQFILFVPDQMEKIVGALQFIMKEEEVKLVIVSGGLGPTEDDLTREAVAQAFGRSLIFSPEAWDRIQFFYRELRNTEPPENNRRQAFIPQGAEILYNERGTAPGFKLEVNGKSIFVIPGVPREAEFFWSLIEKDLPREEEYFYRSPIFKFCGIGESNLAKEVEPFLRHLPSSFNLAFLPNYGEVWLYVYSSRFSPEEKESALIFLEEVARHLDRFFFSPYGDTLEEAVGNMMKEKGLKLGLAESCTGGLVANRITDIAGSSQYFERGYVVYSNEAKKEDLKVPEEILQEKGAVSEETARFLARGVRHKGKVDLGLGITGIAGPGGGSKEKPVGLVYIALSSEEGVRVQKFHFSGDRLMNKRFASQSALVMIFQYLKEKFGNEFNYHQKLCGFRPSL